MKMITSEQKSKLIKGVQAHKTDTGSASVQVAILTDRIKQLTEHLKNNKHDSMTRRGLMQMVGQRRRLLRYIADHDSESYLKLIKQLGIRR